MRQLRNPDGTPMTLGVPSLQGIGEGPGVRFISPEESTMTKADQDSIYELNGVRFFIAAGDELPEGAAVVSAADAVELALSEGAASDEATPDVDVEALQKELEAVKAERDTLLAEKEATIEGDGSGETLPEVTDYPDDAKPIEPIEPDERAKGKAPQNKAKGAAPENREA